jgi:hypothetical protein
VGLGHCRSHGRPAANCPPCGNAEEEWFSRSEDSADTGHPGETSRCFAERGSESDRRLVREYMLQAVQGTKDWSAISACPRGGLLPTGTRRRVVSIGGGFDRQR